MAPASITWTQGQGMAAVMQRLQQVILTQVFWHAPAAARITT
jgi:hypothetical protein